uniref:Uncharacterized protein n=1 Tax=Leersia perrieri TaxID=77586 RepID=A0A0D9XHH2_9ORYZ
MDAVVSASHGALGPLLGKLNNMLAVECAKLKGIRREIQFLKLEPSNMQAALYKYASIDDPDIEDKTWITELRELAHDIEDCIDKFIHQLGANDEQHDTSTGIKEFFKNKNKSMKQCKVLSIVGFGGLGKTTLANERIFFRDRIFPEDYMIERDMLLWRWISEGFILEDYRHNFEDVANDYFHEQINKSLVQPVDIGFDGKLSHLKYLRIRNWGTVCLPTQIAKLQNLLTLDLSETSLEEVPTETFRLSKLQRLLGNNLKLPDGIGSMRNLQVLRGIDICPYLETAVVELGELTNLRDLKIRLYYEPSKRTEEMLLASHCKLSSYKLQSLHIIDDSSHDFLDRWFPFPCSLRSFCMTTNYYLPQLPNWIKPSLTVIAYLNINIRDMKEEDLRTLGELPALLSVHI